MVSYFNNYSFLISNLLYIFVLIFIFLAITDEFEPNRKYSEQDWNETASETSNVYSFSKVSAEREAVTSASREGTKFSLVTILPGTVLGPHLGIFHYFL